VSLKISNSVNLAFTTQIWADVKDGYTTTITGDSTCTFTTPPTYSIGNNRVYGLVFVGSMEMIAVNNDGYSFKYNSSVGTTGITVTITNQTKKFSTLNYYFTHNKIYAYLRCGTMVTDIPSEKVTDVGGTLTFTETNEIKVYINFDYTKITDRDLMQLSFSDVDTTNQIGEIMHWASPIDISTTTIWIGATDGYWDTAENWSNGVPQDGFDVVIPYTGHPGPAITTETATIKTLEIASEIYLQSTLNCSGNIVNKGTIYWQDNNAYISNGNNGYGNLINEVGSTVDFSNSTETNLAPSFMTNIYYNLKVSSGTTLATIGISDDITINGDLIINGSIDYVTGPASWKIKGSVTGWGSIKTSNSDINVLIECDNTINVPTPTFSDNSGKITFKAKKLAGGLLGTSDSGKGTIELIAEDFDIGGYFNCSKLILSAANSTEKTFTFSTGSAVDEILFRKIGTGDVSFDFALGSAGRTTTPKIAASELKNLTINANDGFSVNVGAVSDYEGNSYSGITTKDRVSFIMGSNSGSINQESPLSCEKLYFYSDDCSSVVNLNNEQNAFESIEGKSIVAWINNSVGYEVVGTGIETKGEMTLKTVTGDIILSAPLVMNDDIVFGMTVSPAGNVIFNYDAGMILCSQKSAADKGIHITRPIILQKDAQINSETVNHGYISFSETITTTESKSLTLYGSTFDISINALIGDSAHPLAKLEIHSENSLELGKPGLLAASNASYTVYAKELYCDAPLHLVNNFSLNDANTAYTERVTFTKPITANDSSFSLNIYSNQNNATTKTDFQADIGTETMPLSSMYVDTKEICFAGETVYCEIMGFGNTSGIENCQVKQTGTSACTFYGDIWFGDNCSFTGNAYASIFADDFGVLQRTGGKLISGGGDIIIRGDFYTSGTDCQIIHAENAKIIFESDYGFSLEGIEYIHNKGSLVFNQSTDAQFIAGESELYHIEKKGTNVLTFASDLTQNSNADFLVTEGTVVIAEKAFVAGNLKVSSGATFKQTGNNVDAEQSIATLTNEGEMIWDSNKEGGTLVLRGEILGSKQNEIAFNKKNITIEGKVNLTGIFYDLYIPINATVTNAGEIAVLRNFTLDGTYIHNDKELIFGGNDSENGEIVCATESFLGNVRVDQKTTEKTFSTGFTARTFSAAGSGKIQLGDSEEDTFVLQESGFIFDESLVLAGKFQGQSFESTETITALTNLTITAEPGGISLGKIDARDKTIVCTAKDTVKFRDSVFVAVLKASSSNEDVLLTNTSSVNASSAEITGQNVSVSGTILTDENISLKAVELLTVTNELESKTGNIVLEGKECSLEGKLATSETGSVEVSATNGSLGIAGEIASAGNVNLTSDELVSLTGVLIAHDDILLTSENAYVGGTVQANQGKIMINSPVFIGDETIFKTNSGLFIGNETNPQNLIISAPSKKVTFIGDVQVTGSCVIFHGAVAFPKTKNFCTMEDFVLLSGSAATMYRDSETSLDLFKYQDDKRSGYTELASFQEEFPKNHPIGTEINHTDYTTTVSDLAGCSFAIGKNFYDNGVSLQGTTEWNIAIPDSEKNNYFAEVYNATIAYAQVSVFNEGQTAWVTAGENCIDGGNNSDITYKDAQTGIAFYCPKISDKTKTVYDDTIYIQFEDELGNPRLIENSNNEITKLLSVIKTNDGKISFSGAFVDKDCTESTDNKGDISEFYLKTSGDSSQRWNTDATGSSAGDRASETPSTDYGRSSEKPATRAVVPNIEIAKATDSLWKIMTDAYGNRLKHYPENNRFTATKDGCAPVLIEAFTGQEIHRTHDGNSEKSQYHYDSHNFIELRYSEAVSFGDISYDEACENVPVQKNFDSASSHGGDIECLETGLEIAGFVTIENGSLKVGRRSKDNKIVDDSPHALYRKFALNPKDEPKNQDKRVRFGIVSYVEGTISQNGKQFHFWPGFIIESKTPTGTVLPLENKFITDKSGNILSTKTAQPLVISNEIEKDKVYGPWDTTAPAFAPFYRGNTLESWTAYHNEYEVLGAYFDEVGYLERFYVHLFDNVPTYSATDKFYWKSGEGWADFATGEVIQKAQDIFGGSRGFPNEIVSDANKTSGGIRLSSLFNSIQGFTYKNSFTSEFLSFKENFEQKIADVDKSFFEHDTDPTIAPETDSLYLTLLLSETQRDFPIKDVFTLRYQLYSDVQESDQDGGFVTDLAGNLLSSAIISSIDRSPPKFSFTVAPVGKKELYVVFSKKISCDGEDLVKIPQNLELVSKDGKISSSINIESSIPARIATDYRTGDVKNTEKSTGLIVSLTHPVKYEDLFNLYLRVKKPSSQRIDPITNKMDYIPEIYEDTPEKDNAMAYYTMHALSDFAVNAVDINYAYDQKDAILDNHIIGNNEWFVRDFSGTKGRVLSERDITFNVRIDEGASQENIVMLASTDVSEDTRSKEYNSLTDSAIRVWLPTQKDAFSYTVNTLIKEIASSDTLDVTTKNYLLPNAPDNPLSFNWQAGQQIEIIFKLKDKTIDFDGTSLTPEEPLYFLRLADPENITSLDIWSVSLASMYQQRGGVTVLNNVINPVLQEHVKIEVNLPKASHLAMYVTTLDGRVVKTLSKDMVSQGKHYFYWDGKTSSGKYVARGMYFVRVVGSGIDETRKVLVIK